ncbi:MAG TPA: tetratricopeptide repeat protein [Deltaproteobacteria bacterium]|nr:tetratricopeptide repeat protein [Deltaproteobacteria bacterium]
MHQIVMLWLALPASGGTLPLAGDPIDPAPRDDPRDDPPGPHTDPPGPHTDPPGPHTDPGALLPDAGVNGSFDATLRAAKQGYFSGEPERARDLLHGLYERLEAGEEPGWELSLEAMTYLGAVQHKLGDQQEAREAFRWILERDLEAPISPYHHPIDVLNLFELVRVELRAEQERPQPPFDPGPPPVWAFTPLGIPQFSQGRTAAGLLYGGLQTAFGITSVAMFAHLAEINVTDDTPHPLGWDPADTFGRVQLRRYAVQWPATIAFYGAWMLSVSDANRHWRSRPPPATIQVGIAPLSSGGTGIVLSRPL